MDTAQRHVKEEKTFGHYAKKFQALNADLVWRKPIPVTLNVHMEVCQGMADAKIALEPVQESAVKLVSNHFQKYTSFI